MGDCPRTTIWVGVRAQDIDSELLALNDYNPYESVMKFLPAEMSKVDEDGFRSELYGSDADVCKQTFGVLLEPIEQSGDTIGVGHEVYRFDWDDGALPFSEVLSQQLIVNDIHAAIVRLFKKHGLNFPVGVYVSNDYC